jgi:hypothetical protein
LVVAGEWSRPESSSGVVWSVLFYAGSAVSALGIFYGFVRAGEWRSRKVSFLERTGSGQGILSALLAGVVAVYAVRFTVASDWFGESDAFLWSPWGKGATSWVQAAVVATVLAVVALLSTRRPLVPRTPGLVALAFASIAGIELLISLVVVVRGLILAAFTGQASFPSDFVDYSRSIQIVLLCSLAVTVALPPFRATAARWVTVVSLLYLLPALTVIAAIQEFGADPPRWLSVATSVQVGLALLVVAAVLWVARFFLPPDTIPAGLIFRLAVVPVVVLHAAVLLPEVLRGVDDVLIVATVVASILFFMPKRSPDSPTWPLAFLGASTAQVLVLVVFVFASSSLFKNETFATAALLWLFVTVTAGLAFQLRRRAEPAE